jgi:microcin C transport system substrate-binding protein
MSEMTPPHMTRILFAACLLLWAVIGHASIHKSHAITLYDEAPKYGPGFSHFDYVNPAAPKGGVLRTAEEGTFDSFHSHIPKGNAAGTGAVETLLTSSEDEPFTEYGLIAETIEWPDDRSWVIFNLRPEARWHDGEPITADDVVWSFETLIARGAPQYRFYYSSVERVEKLAQRRVKFHFKERNNRELPMIVGQLPILPKHYWQGRNFEKTTLEPPLGSGPYQVSRFEAGRFIVQKRVENYWGRDLPVNRGRFNFDEIRTDYYRDVTAIRLALKSGDIDFRAENQAKAWAVDYQVPAVEKGWLKMERVSHRMPTGMQGFVINTRRPLFRDVKVREALGYAFDFEWTNRNLFFSQYTRTQSYFSNSEMAADGPPGEGELELLNEYRGRIPRRIFDEIYQPPGTDGSGWSRDNLLQADRLLKEAGWIVRDLRRVHAGTGEPFRFEVLLYSPAFERIVLPMARNLKRLGIDVSIRLVDQTQYVNRLRSFDFDMVVTVWGQSENPGNEQRNYWTSAAADQPGSRNMAGIKDEVVDELVERLVSSRSREQLISTARVLDRVLQFGFYVIPNWHIPADRILYWDKFSRPGVKVKSGVMTSRWWYDAARAEQLQKKIDSNRQLLGDSDPSGNSGWRWLLLIALIGAGLVAMRRYLAGRG